MDGLFDKKSDFKKALDEYFKKVDAIRKLPEYQDFLKYREECQQFAEFINEKRINKTHTFIKSFVENEEVVINWLERVKKLEKRLGDSAWKRHESHSSSKIMDHIWEVAQKHGRRAEVESMFGNEAFIIGKFTIEVYSGQGEYGYAVYINKRIF